MSPIIYNIQYLFHEKWMGDCMFNIWSKKCSITTFYIIEFRLELYYIEYLV